MTKKKLEKTNEIKFHYRPGFNGKHITVLKDGNEEGRKYTLKGVYSLIETLNSDYRGIKCYFEKEAEDRIREYAQGKEKSEGLIDVLKKSGLEIAVDK